MSIFGAMKFSAYSLLFSALWMLLFNSCKNKLKLNAPYKEIPSIFAILNPQERIQMIRINKVFLGEGDANQMAQVADSINYPAGELTVTLDRYVDGTQVNASPNNPDPNKRKTIVFRDSVIQSSPGAFNTTQRVYVCSDDLHQGNKGTTIGPNTYTVFGNYVLTVKNNKTGNVFTGRAAGIDSVLPRLAPFTPTYYPAPQGTAVNGDNFIDYSNQTTTYNIRFFPVPNGQVYQVVARMHYADALGNSDYIDYIFNGLNAKDAEKNGVTADQLKASFRGQDLFGAAGIAFSKKNMNTSVSRRMLKIQFFVYASSQDYIDYLQFVSPSLSVTQSKPLYSNFDNQAALGLFAFRSRCSVVKEMATFFISEFAYNRNTCAYGFLTASGTRPGCN